MDGASVQDRCGGLAMGFAHVKIRLLRFEVWLSVYNKTRMWLIQIRLSIVERCFPLFSAYKVCVLSCSEKLCLNVRGVLP